MKNALFLIYLLVLLPILLIRYYRYRERLKNAQQPTPALSRQDLLRSYNYSFHKEMELSE